MYLAPFNYDRFFGRAFSKPEIAKRFFEDILDIVITEIEPLPRKTKLTVDAAYVEFDYRCKIDGQYAILDMQQWYKQDVVKRFYMYDANNTSLQMESLMPVSIPGAGGKEYKTRDYNQIEPTTTIVWMVDDCLGYKENIISFAMTPDLLTDFIRNNEIWGANDLKTLLKLRAEILKIMDNDTKGISFLSKNKLMFVFQKNIIKSPKMAKYVKWFKFAETTKKADNVEKDFEPYKNDPIFAMIMNELMVNNFDTDDFQYITDYAAFEKGYQAYKDKTKREAYKEAYKEVYEDARNDAMKIATEIATQQVLKQYEPKIKETEIQLELTMQEKQQAEKEKQQAEKEKQQAEKEKQQAELKVQQIEKDVLEKKLRYIQKSLKRGDTNEEIADLLEIELEQLKYYLTLLPDEE